MPTAQGLAVCPLLLILMTCLLMDDHRVIVAAASTAGGRLRVKLFSSVGNLVALLPVFNSAWSDTHDTSIYLYTLQVAAATSRPRSIRGLLYSCSLPHWFVVPS